MMINTHRMDSSENMKTITQKSTAKNHKDLFYNNLHGLGYFVSESLRSFNRSSDNMLLRVTIHVTEGLNLLVFAEQQNIIYLMGYLFLKQ